MTLKISSTIVKFQGGRGPAWHVRQAGDRTRRLIIPFVWRPPRHGGAEITADRILGARRRLTLSGVLLRHFTDRHFAVASSMDEEILGTGSVFNPD